MKKTVLKIFTGLMAVVPTIACFAMVASANSTASPFIGQPTPPESLKKYRKF